MTRKEWILANLEGKVQLRALRACGDRVIYDSCERDWTLKSLFTWHNTKEGHDYWAVIHGNLTNPDQYLPKGYVDVDHIPEIGKMVEDKFLERLEMRKTETFLGLNVIKNYTFKEVIEKYNELKNTQVKS